MKWVVSYKRASIGDTQNIKYNDADSALYDMALCLKAGHTVQQVDRQDWYEDDQKTPDPTSAIHVPYDFEKGDHR